VKKALPVLLTVAVAVSMQVAAPDVTMALAPLPSAVQRSGMVDKPGAANKSNTVAVRAIVQAGSLIWVGGVFDEIDGPGGGRVADASNLAAFDASSGLMATVHIPAVTANQGQAEVYDMSLGPDGKLYLAGHFDHLDGLARQGVAAIDPASGAVLPFAPKAGTPHTILASATAIYAGGTRLLAFHLDGSRPRGYVPPLVETTGSVRTEMTSPQFRDIAKLGSTIVAACQCDSLTDANGTHAVKAVVELDAATGALLNWVPTGLAASSPASGLSVIVHVFPGTTDPTVYLAAGGNDFTAAYDFRTGARRWIEDTSGSSQSVIWYRNYLVVGGHFDWTQAPGGPKCGTNASPDHGCMYTPKLVAMDGSTGAILPDPSGRPWNPGICCRYNGVWALLRGADGTSLYVGGEFTEAGGSWSCKRAWGPCLNGASTQKFFARFEPPPPPGS
jgi:hypothetical protein